VRFPKRSDLLEVGAYATAVARHFISFGWFVLAGVLGIVSEFTGSLRFLPTWAWWTLAMVGLTVAQFRAYHDVASQIAEARARAGDLDTEVSKRAYLNEQIAGAARLQEEIESEEFADGGEVWLENQPRIDADLKHWEREVRASLRRWFPPGTDRLFDSEEGLMDDKARAVPLGHPARTGGYIERRRTRLEQIRDEL
jgi:hypothetical protein